MTALASTPDPEDESQIQEAITAVLARQNQDKALGLGAVLAELLHATASKVLSLTNSRGEEGEAA